MWDARCNERVLEGWGASDGFLLLAEFLSDALEEVVRPKQAVVAGEGAEGGVLHHVHDARPGDFVLAGDAGETMPSAAWAARFFLPKPVSPRVWRSRC